MHEWGDSGITAVLLAIGVALLLGFFFAQQARTRAARYEEIRCLQSVAAEQARREEEEARAEYTSMVANRNFCAVCFNPTTTRCSRCKAVRYCSSTCQVKHWKDGHKQECRAPDPVPSPGSSSNGSRNFSEVFSSNGSSGSGGSRNFSEVFSSNGSSGNGGSRNFSEVFSSNGSSGSGGSITFSEVSEEHSVDDATPAELTRTTTAATNRDGTLLKPKKVLFPYEYFVKFFNWERLQVPPCGLLNCGNSCFANVVLQCLTYTRPLTAYLLEGTHGEECRRSDWCFLCELQDHVWRVRQSHNPFSPIRILSRIRNIGNHLGYGRQEDAHEFMRFAIDSMQSICLDEAGGEKAVEPRSQETTFIYYIFGGHLQSQVKCMQCLHESNRYENMMDLAVEIHGCVETLEDALTQFTAPEWLDGENKYKCDRCNAYVKARKRLTLHEAPNILTIALKRFQSGKFGKLNKRVTFPEVLDVSPYMSGKGDRPPLYRLYAVVVHVDMLNASFFGHYICYVKDSQGLWYKIDDSKVKEVDLEKVMAQRAYMLFYTRSTARPPPLMDGAVSPYPVAGAVDMGSIISDRHGVLKVVPSSHYVGSEEVLASGGSQGLHAMVDFNQMVDYVDANPETVTEQHMLPNGEIATIQPSSWETERIRSSTPNDDEIEREDEVGIASSSSLTQTSPYMSSFTSNQGLWIPTQGFVQCQVPESGSVEGREFAAWDPKLSLHDDFSEVSLQPCVVDKPCNNTKIGKRRLEDGLSPLPTPKPLDTDQLPAWPASSEGRSNSCLPPVHHLSPASPIISSIPDAAHSSLQKYECGNIREPSLSGTFPLHQAVLLRESSPEPEWTDYITVETTGSEEEEMAVRAKRQHVETNRVVDPVVRIQRPDEILKAKEDLNSSDLGGSEMDWDPTILHSESPTSGAILGPVSDPPDRHSSVHMSMSSSHGQDVLNQQAALWSSLPLKSGGLERSTDGVAFEVHKLEESQQGTAMTMESSQAPQLVSLPEGGWKKQVLEAAACHPEVTWQDQPSQSVDQDITNHEPDTTALKEPISFLTSVTTVQASNGPVPQSNGPTFYVPDMPRPGKAQKGKSTSQPLFAPGFLNKARTPVGSKSKSSSGKPRKATAVENGYVTKVEEGEAAEDVPPNDQKCSSNGEPIAKAVAIVPEVGQLRPSEGTYLVAVNDDTSEEAPDDKLRNCGNRMNCDICHSAHSDRQLENGHQTVGCRIPDSNDNHLGKNGSKNGPGASSSSKAATRLNASVNGNGSLSQNSPLVNKGEDPPVEPVRETVAAVSSQAANGKQKQGRNETCNCGSQRKWKKCCGKTGVRKPELQTRRLVV